jgi:purine nucleoside phosphorylase
VSPARRQSLDACVGRAASALVEARVPSPDVLFLMATGVHGLAERFSGAREIPLEEIPGVVEPWKGALLRTGSARGLTAWAIDDLAGEPGFDESPAWAAGFPAWLAAAAGATLCVHTSAGCLLPAERPERGLALGGFALTRDHLNLTGRSPLAGLGESRLGPLFPDLSGLHHLGLRRAALASAEALGLDAAEAVVACTSGPALETAAERAMLARLGAEVAVQSLAAPLHACGHAGLALLSIVALVDDGRGAAEPGLASTGSIESSIGSLIERARTAEPALEDLLAALFADLELAAAALAAERDA